MAKLERPRDPAALILLVDGRGQSSVVQLKDDGLWGPIDRDRGAMHWNYITTEYPTIVVLRPTQMSHAGVLSSRPQKMDRFGRVREMTEELASVTAAALDACLQTVDIKGDERDVLDQARAIMDEWGA